MRRRTLILAALLAAVTAGCGGKEKKTPMATTTVEPEPAAVLTADVLQVEPSKESVPYATAVLAFKNPGPEVVRVLRYKLSWPGGEKTVDTDPFEVPASGVIERRLRVDASAGDVEALLEKSAEARVKILSASSVK